MDVLLLGIAIGASAVLLLVLLSGFYTVGQQSFAIVERFGKFKSITSPGLNWRIPIADQVVTRVSVRVRELIVHINTKTKDNVFVDLELAVQYQVRNAEDAWNAWYTLTDHEQQMESFVYDTVRAKVPTMELDQVFENKDDIADDVKATLAEKMQAYGYTIVQSLVNDVRPAENVAVAMNEIVAQERLRRAAEHRAQAEYITVVKAAEADAESKRLAGEGIANQRKAIVQGYQESVAGLQQATGVDAREIMSVVLMTQYFDALRDMASNGRNSVIFSNHAPGEIASIQQQFLDAIVAAQNVGAQPPAGSNGAGRH
ncbi:MAG: SPFH domain-containing protein [Dehalococcoidia bacterium]|nr:SPFH domain-containing protein [Dehalococcoidia bacterium]MCA9855848.1 SPFH domain-containing protein [Dehalococcoidia bacterium]